MHKDFLKSDLINILNKDYIKILLFQINFIFKHLYFLIKLFFLFQNVFFYFKIFFYVSKI